MNDARRAGVSALFAWAIAVCLFGCSGSDEGSASTDDAASDAAADEGIANDSAPSDDAAPGGDAAPSDGSSSDTSPADASSDAPADVADGGKPGLGFSVGTNLSGAEFGPVPGTYDKDYTYPTHAEVDYFVGKGFKVLRIPFRWERLQPTLGGALSSTELARLKSLVSYVTSKGAHALVDPHNYARYNDQIVGASSVTTANLAQFWSLVAKEFAGDPLVWLGVMNEPHDMSTSLWLTDANAAIAEIRKAGAKNLILVPGNFWTGAHSWVGTDASSNSNVMGGVVDPLDNFVYEMHQYLDSDSSGTHAACVSGTIGSERLKSATDWLAAHGAHAFLGEFGASTDATCLAAVDDMLKFVDAHRAQWIGWTWWSAGPWWGDYMYSLEPSGGTDKPQMAVLMKHE